MQHCWQTSESRPQISQIYSMLMHLLQQYQQNKASKSPSKLPNFPMEDFDSRWETFKPNTIVKTDNHVTLNVPSDKMTDVSSVSSSEIFVNPEKQKSPSLTNLHGSLENLIEDEAETTPVQNMDSWLQNVANHTSDMQYVRGLSQAIQALDSALASEQTSSSASSFERSPAPESLETSQDQFKIDFKLNQESSIDESSNLMDSIMYRRTDSGSETEDETWKKRIERGAYSEKVRQKSKSVADLMILTHIDCSDTDSETPQQSLECRVNYKNIRCKPSNSLENSTLMFGSEGNLLEVQDTFQEELRKLQEERRDSLLFVPACHSSQVDIEKTPDDYNTISYTNIEYDNGLSKSQPNVENTILQREDITKTPNESISAITNSDSDHLHETCVNKTLPIETCDLSAESENLIKIIDDKIKTELGNVKIDTKDDNQNKIFSDISISESEQTTEHTKNVNETDDSKEKNKEDNAHKIIIDAEEIKPDSNDSTQKIDDTLIRQEVANLIKEISSEAEEKVFEQINHKNDNTESQTKDNIQKEDNQVIEECKEVLCDNEFESGLKHKVESFLQAEIEHDTFKVKVNLESPEKKSFILNDSQQIAEPKDSFKSVDLEISSNIQDIHVEPIEQPDLTSKSVEAKPIALIGNVESDEITKHEALLDLVETPEKIDESLNAIPTESDISSELVINLEENVAKPEKEEEKITSNINIEETLIDLQETSETERFDSDILKTINPNLVKSPEQPDEIFTLSQENLQELHNVDNRNKPVEISKIITCTKEDYSLVQNFINNERNGPFVELEKIIDNSSRSAETTETTLIPANLLDLHDPSNTQPINQVYNVYSVQIDHKPPPEVFDSPIKNFYAKPFNETDIITGISGLILESERKTLETKSPEKLLSKLNLVCTSSLPNEHIFNVLNTPPLINGYDSDLSNKINVNLKDEHKILRENCHDNHKFEENLLKNAINNTAMTNSQETIVNNDFDEEESEDNTVKIVPQESSIAENSIFNTCEVSNEEDSLKNNNEVLLPRNVTIVISESTSKQSNLSENSASCSSPKKLSDLASDILLQHCLYMNENSELKRSNTLLETLNNSQNNSTNETCYNPRKLSDIILESLTNNPEYKNESIASADFTRNESNKEETLQNNILKCHASNIVTSTPFKPLSKNIEEKDSLSEPNRLFSFVSEGDEASDSQTTVILGPCEDYTLGLYSGLKTTFEQYYDDDRPEEEILQFSSNFMPLTDESIVNECQYFPNKQLDAATASTVDFSLETWDRFLGKTLQDHDNGPTSIFDHENFTPRNESLDVFTTKNSTETVDNSVKEQNQTIDLPNLNKTYTLDRNLVTNDQTIDIEEETTNNKTFVKQKSAEDDDLNKTVTLDKAENNDKNRTFILDKVENEVPNVEDAETSVLNSWEPGEGWFLHPQVPPESLTGDIDISGSDNTDENSYIRFALDEECVNALRNELAAKLPHAQVNTFFFKKKCSRQLIIGSFRDLVMKKNN